MQRFTGILREPVTLPAKQTGLALLSVLSLAMAVAAPILGLEHQRRAEETPAVVNGGPSAPSGHASMPGSWAGPTGPAADWALAEGGLHGSTITASTKGVQEWGWAEGRYYWDPGSRSPAGKRHGH